MYDGKTHFVAHITLVKGVPFYGYHVGYELFLKIYMFNPLHMTRLADLLRQGAIMKKVIQPFESHMQYLLQWMCDYNLYGCAYIDCKEVRFRHPVPNYLDVTSSSHKWHDRSIPSLLVSDPETISRQSHCSLEIDIMVQHILNRDQVKLRPIHHDFTEKNTAFEPPTEKLVHSMAGLWRDETRRRKLRAGMADSDSSPFPPEVLVSVSADPRYSQPGGWIHEEEYRDKIDVIAEGEKKQSDGQPVTFDGFLEALPLEVQIKTSLESIEDLYPQNLTNMSHSGQGMNIFDSKVTDAALPDVDESRVLSFEEDDYPYESDEELARELEMSQKVDREGLEVKLPRKNCVTRPSKEPSHLHPESNANSSLPADDDKSSTRDAQGPTSSSELEELGIRKAGDFGHVGEDAFEIPLDFRSEISAERAGTNELSPEHQSKRRKIGYDGGVHETSPHEDRPPESDGQKSCKPNGHAMDIPKVDTVALEASEVAKDLHESQLSLPYSLSSSQDGLRMSSNARLSFPVVKGLQEPTNTSIFRQRKKAASNSSQDRNTKVVSFDSPKVPSASLSSQPKSLSTVSLGSPSVSFTQAFRPSSLYHQAFDINSTSQILAVENEPPSTAMIALHSRSELIPHAIYQDAYYSDERDVPDRPREYAGKEFKLESTTVPYLPDFDPSGTSHASTGEKQSIVADRAALDAFHESRKAECSLRMWEVEGVPPTRFEVQQWLNHALTQTKIQNQPSACPPDKEELSQVEGATQKNRHGFKYSQKQKSTSVQHETQYMSIMSLELHVNTRAGLVPDPEQDEICSVFWCVQSDDEDLVVNGTNEGTHVGILALSEHDDLARKISQLADVEVESETTELDLITRMVDIVRGFDPDILTGYEVHGGSWGYMIERARYKYDYNLCDEFSRMLSNSHGRFGKDDDRWGFNHTSTIRVTGRHMINIWRAMRGELNLLQYTMENVVFQLCHRRIPHYSYRDLTCWYSSGKPKDLAKVINYYISRVQLDLEILEQNELVPRTSEQARLLGVDFFSVFSRGSQFKVESLMFRIAKPENFLLPSPSRKQVGQQNALECLPLVMEPQSAFYNSPLLVLDFQSLYPSVMIAYNYCYSTCLGRVVNWRGQNKMGFAEYQRKPRVLELLHDHINIAPNGIMYVKPEIRKSLLAKMLGEILETRVMVKSGMKVDKDDKTLQRLLNNRQLALKLIANVTYGYTSASFSGRMPCSEIADSIVQTGRETLEKAIALIHSVDRWGAEVVYGDTDSLFVYLKGRTKDEAFDIGQEIANTITDMNPRPVKLKFEKVYFPCVLLAKKRYVGFKYENKTQEVPDFDAKGIETVRRDGTPAEQKIEEKALKILFRTSDLTQVKSYFQRQCTKIMQGRVSIQDFCFAKEVKLGTYSDKGVPPPGVLISTRRMLEDPRAEPQYGERVPYVVITGAPGARLIDRCVAPETLLHNEENDLDAEYYISKNLIPPLERIFNLVGANVRQWYDEMPKFQRIRRIDNSSILGGKDILISRKTLESYMKSSSCLVCREKLEEEASVCNRCMQEADMSVLILQSRLGKAERTATVLEETCRSCSGLAFDDAVRCDSKDCPVFYTRTRHMASLRSTLMATKPVMDLLTELEAKGTEW